MHPLGDILIACEYGVFTSPGDSCELLMKLMVQAWITIVKLPEVLMEVWGSNTKIWTGKLPAWVGVPERSPALPGIVRPGGSPKSVLYDHW
jgi:hypothetical protein